MSSKRRKRRSDCEGKVRHANADAAWTALRHTNNAGRRMHIYRCPWCRKWHIGHAKRWTVL